MRTIIIIILTAISVNLAAQAPDWNVYSKDNLKHMSVYIAMSGSCGTSGDILALFNEADVIKGVSEVDKGSNEFFIIARSDAGNGEILHFKYYDSESDSVFTLLNQTIEYTNNIIIGADIPMAVNSPESVSPIALCNSFDLFLNTSGNANITIDDVDAGSSDNCSFITRSIDKTSLDCSTRGLQLVTLTITDASQNESTCVANVTILDTIPPTLLCKNIEVFLDASGNAQITPESINDYSSDNCTLLPMSINIGQFDCSNLGTNTVTLTGQDNSANKSSCVANVTVSDTLSPIINCNNIEVILNGNGQGLITTSDINNGSTDNCSIQSIFLSKTAFDCSDVGTPNVTLTVTDNSNNVSNCKSIITVTDNTKPSANCKNINVTLSSDGTTSIIVTDINNGSSDNCSIATMTLSQSEFNCADVGTQNVTLGLIDAIGNSANCVAVVTVSDTIKPVVSQRDTTLFLDATGMAHLIASDLIGHLGSLDACTADPIVSMDIQEFTCEHIGPNSVTIQVTDPSGNKTTTTSVVTVGDSIAPTVISKDKTLYLDAAGMVSLTADEIIESNSDNCAIASAAIDKEQFSCTHVGENSVKLTVVDHVGNSTTNTNIITIVDTISPTLSCIDITKNIDQEGQVNISTTDIHKDAYDACSIASVAISRSQFSCADIGINSVAVMITDSNGNANTCTAKITIVDPSNNKNEELRDDFVTGPTMLCPGNKGVSFTSMTDNLEGSISWSYTGNGVKIIPSANTLNCTIDLAADATAGNLIATFQGICHHKTATIPISLSDALRCSLFSNCPFYVYMTANDLERSDRPDIIQSQSEISVEGQVAGPMLYFKAGESIEFRNNFEVMSGSNVEAAVESCDE